MQLQQRRVRCPTQRLFLSLTTASAIAEVEYLTVLCKVYSLHPYIALNINVGMR